MTWEVLRTLRGVAIRRHGRFLVADLQAPHRVLSTSARVGGLTEDVRHLVNHQSCEGTGHDARFHVITADGPDAYHDAVCAEIGLPPLATAVMGTAANMHYAAIVSARDEDVEVTAVVTAGVQSNATTAGEPATWRETSSGMVRVTATPASTAGSVPAAGPASAGTINTMLIVDTPLTPAALARTVITMTEAKSAALQRLAVPSRTSADLATGTGTDQYCLAAPIAPAADGRGLVAITSASPHVKFGEMVGAAVRDATLEALRWQNGLEASYTRGLFHALGRYGVLQRTIFDDLAAADLLEAADLDLLRKNAEAVFYEPLVGAAAHALAAVLDRVRHGTLPSSVAPDALVQQAATLAASLAAQPDRWPEFRARLHATAGGADVKRLVLAAVALGWSEKWRGR